MGIARIGKSQSDLLGKAYVKPATELVLGV